MSQLALSLDISDGAQEALRHFANDKAQRAVAVSIEGERIECVGSAVPASDSLAADLAALRQALAECPCCFVFVRVGDGIDQVALVPDAQPPKVRMLYASSSAHLRKTLPCGLRGDHHIISVEALVPPLFAEESNADMMTESEKAQHAIEQMPVAPTGSALPGMGLTFNADAEAALTKFKDGGAKAVAFAVAGGVASSVWSTSSDDPVESMCVEVGDANPRFVLLTWETKTIFLYLCPAAAKPRDRMSYSVSKVAFAAQLSQREVEVAKSVELDSTEGAKAAIAEALKGGVVMEAVAPTAAAMVKGPRLFFQ